METVKVFVYDSLVRMTPTAHLPSLEFKSDEAFTDFLALDSQPFIQEYIRIQLLLDKHWTHRKNAALSDSAMLEIEKILNRLGDLHPYLLLYADHIAWLIIDHYQGGITEEALKLPPKEAMRETIETMQKETLVIFIPCFDVDFHDGRELSPLQRYVELTEQTGKQAIPVRQNVMRIEKEDGSIDYDFAEIVEPQDIFTLLDYFVLNFLKRGLQFKKCKNCGKYFLLTANYKVEYCLRLFEDTGKTCREIGASHTYLKKNKDNPIMQAYQKAYKRNFARIKYGKITKEAFEMWSEQAREMRDQALKGNISLEEFEQSLR